jgi:hypothetical protein
MPVARVPFYLLRLSRIIRSRYEAIIRAPLIAGFFLSPPPRRGGGEGERTIFAVRTLASSRREFDHVNGTRRPRWIDRTQINIRELVIAEPAVFSLPRPPVWPQLARIKAYVCVYRVYRDERHVYPCRYLRCYLSRRDAHLSFSRVHVRRVTYITREIVRFASRTDVCRQHFARPIIAEHAIAASIMQNTRQCCSVRAFCSF